MAEVHILEDAPTARGLYRMVANQLCEINREALDQLLKRAWVEGYCYRDDSREFDWKLDSVEVGA